MAILNLWYSITRNGDAITISSNTGLPINIKVSIKESCQDNKYNQIQEYNTTTTISFNLPYDDGKYKIEITNNQNETYTYYIPKYDNMLKSLISDIELILCDCKCKHCNDCTQTTEKDYSSVLLKLLSYYVLNKEYYEAFLNIVFECTECALEDAFKCVLLNEKVYGNSENTELFKKIISHFYLGFYYGKLGYINNLEETNKLFNYDRIYHCIKNSGINTTCIENKKTDMATVTMNTEGVPLYTFEVYPGNSLSEVCARTSGNQLKGFITTNPTTSSIAYNSDYSPYISTYSHIKIFNYDGIYGNTKVFTLTGSTGTLGAEETCI